MDRAQQYYYQWWQLQLRDSVTEPAHASPSPSKIPVQNQSERVQAQAHATGEA